MTLPYDQEQELIIRLEGMGVSLVKSEFERGKFSPAYVHSVSVWLASKDKEAEERREASNSAQIELARSAAVEAARASAAAERSATAAERQAVAAERANRRATIAIAIAIVAAMIATFGIWITHMDVHK